MAAANVVVHAYVARGAPEDSSGAGVKSVRRISRQLAAATAILPGRPGCRWDHSSDAAPNANTHGAAPQGRTERRSRHSTLLRADVCREKDKDASGRHVRKLRSQIDRLDSDRRSARDKEDSRSFERALSPEELNKLIHLQRLYRVKKRVYLW